LIAKIATAMNNARCRPTISASQERYRTPAMTKSARSRRMVLIRRFGPAEAFASRQSDERFASPAIRLT
jgi:hypothetical protein